jgi:xanthine dehydrogenase YagS FAD-binding subunit
MSASLSFTRPSSLQETIAILAASPDALAIAGGTEVSNWLRDGLAQPATLVDLRGLALKGVTVGETGLRLGALATLSEVAAHADVRSRYAALSEALLATASGQIRNQATVAGNLMQRTRCPYYRDVALPCVRRDRVGGCSAIGGWTRRHAILGTSDSCIAAHPSDMAVALAALDADVLLTGPGGDRRLPLHEFYPLPGNTPWRETALLPGELVTDVEVPPTPDGSRSTFLKLRDRATFEFALVSVAACVAVRNGVVEHARLALGGVATVPWRARDAEQVLLGKEASGAAYLEAATVALRDAAAQGDNAFKVGLAKSAIIRALETVGGHA